MKRTIRLYSFLTRRNSNRKGRRHKPDDGRAGYALMVMLIAVTVMTIALLAVLPSTYQEARREREEELIFRGNQYAQAIYLFQKHFNRYPNSVKDLLHTDNLSFLRKAWPDPITPGGKWRFIHASGAGAVLDSWTLSPAAGASPLGQNGQNGQNNPINGPNGQNGSNSGFGFGSSGSSGFSGSSSFSLSGGTTSGSSQSDFGWPSTSGGTPQSGGTNQTAGSWDTASSAGQGDATSGLLDTLSSATGLPGIPGSTPPGSTLPGANDSIYSLSPAALRNEEPGRPVDANGKPKMSPDCMAGNQQGSSSMSSGSSASSANSSSFASSSFSSSSSFGSSGSPGAGGSPGSFLSSSQSSSSFASTGSSGGPLGVAIAGVASCSDQVSLRTYNKHHRYSEWEFVGVGYNTGAAGAGITPTQGIGQPGQNGLGQQGQGSSSGFGSGSSSGFGPSGNPSQPGSPGSTGSQPGNAPPPPPNVPITPSEPDGP